MKKVKPLPVQLPNSVECRWGHIMKVCNKFGGCYSQVERQLARGRTCDDIVSNDMKRGVWSVTARCG
jgi:hypothetical protein